MCELFAINAKQPTNANDYLRTFYSHSDLHPHGWGICWRAGDDISLVKEPVRAIDSPHLHALLETPIAQAHLLAHIRLATIGSTNEHNCHPFVTEDESGIEWMLVHNGTVFNDALITGYDGVGQGSTDSERVMLFLRDLLDAAELRKGGELSFDERFAILNSALTKLSNGNKLNILLDDGEYLYVHTNTLKKTLYVKRASGVAVFSTQPLDDDPAWKPVPMAQLQAYRDGELVREGTPHGNVFVECAIENYLLLQSSN